MIRPTAVTRACAVVMMAFGVLDTLAVLLLVAFVGVGDNPAGLVAALAWFLTVAVAAGGVARSAASINHKELIVRNWYRTRHVNLKDVTAVDIGKGSVTPFHRHLRVRLDDGNVIDVLASDRGSSARNELQRLAQQIEAEAKASRAQATDS